MSHNMTKAKSIGRKRRSQGLLWPMPIRETDLGHVHAEITVRPLGDSRKSWTGRALVDTGATDTFLPSSVLRELGIKPLRKRVYELADGTEQELPIGFGIVEILGEASGGTVVFAGECEEPLLGVTILESAGFCVDPRHQRLIPQMPKRKKSRGQGRQGDSR